MNSFEKDFNKELELATRRGSADLPVLQKWNPAGIAPPEIHVARATATNVPIESALYQLRRSPIFQQIANVLQMPLSESVLQTISKQPIDDERVQVWLFGRWWFNTYVEYLLDPLTQRSRFYKERHEEFLTLLRHMLEFQGLRRLTFRAALSAWFPDSDVLTKEAPSEDDGSK